MAALLTKANDYHRPMRGVAVAEFVGSLSGATTPPSVLDLRFPMSEASAVKVAAAINELDTSGQPAVSKDTLKDPWSAATVARLRLVDI